MSQIRDSTMPQEQLEHAIWRKNVPFLYDSLLITPLMWPSLAVALLPGDSNSASVVFSARTREVAGTSHESRNTLVRNDAAKREAEEDEEQGEAKLDRVKGGSVCFARMSFPEDITPVDSLTPRVRRPQFRIVDSVHVGGDVVEFCPKRDLHHSTPMDSEREEEEGESGEDDIHDVDGLPRMPSAAVDPNGPIACGVADGRIVVLDTEVKGRRRRRRTTCTLLGQNAEPLRIRWDNEVKSSYVLSCSDDNAISIWDLEGSGSSGLQPLRVFASAHSQTVSDVTWLPTDSNGDSGGNCLLSVGYDGVARLWDMRAHYPAAASAGGRESVPQSIAALLASAKVRNRGSAAASLSSLPLTCVEVLSQGNDFITGGWDGMLNIWDLRRWGMKRPKPIQHFEYHADPIIRLRLHPTQPGILLAISSDRRVSVWDLARVKFTEEADWLDGPPQLLTLHGGHLGVVSDAAWDTTPGRELTIASVDDGNILQVWEIAEAMFTKDEDIKALAWGEREHARNRRRREREKKLKLERRDSEDGEEDEPR